MISPRTRPGGATCTRIEGGRQCSSTRTGSTKPAPWMEHRLQTSARLRESWGTGVGVAGAAPGDQRGNAGADRPGATWEEAWEATRGGSICSCRRKHLEIGAGQRGLVDSGRSTRCWATWSLIPPTALPVGANQPTPRAGCLTSPSTMTSAWARAAENQVPQQRRGHQDRQAAHGARARRRWLVRHARRAARHG